MVRLQLYYKVITLLCEVAGHQLLVSVRSLLCWLVTLLLHSTDLDSKMAGNSFGGAQPSPATTPPTLLDTDITRYSGHFMP